jgi:hypothetical protein
METMKTFWRIIVFSVLVLFVGRGTPNLFGEEILTTPFVLHIVQSQTTSQGSQQGFPTFLGVYKVLEGVKSPAEALSLTGTLSLKNYTPTFSEVLWVLVYYQGKCPADTDLSLNGATIIWQEIQKNPSQTDSNFNVNFSFAKPLPMTGCVGLYYGGGPLLEGKATMSADLKLAYQPVRSNPNTVIGVGGEYCFGQNWGCQNATAIDGEGFAVPIPMLSSGHLLELYGNISDSTFDGTNSYGPLPRGSWGSVNDFYLLPGGCGIFEENLNMQGFPNPAPLSTLHSWLPKDALHLASIPQVDRIAPGTAGKAALQNQVENIFSVPIKVIAGDCMLVIYGRTGNGAIDNETQVNALMAP